MKKLLLAAAVSLCSLTCAQAKILTVFSDTGISGTDLFVFDGATTSSSSAVGVPEGFSTILTQTAPGGEWGIYYNQTLFPNGVDLSAYRNGELRFWLYVTTAQDFLIQSEHTDHTKETFEITADQFSPGQPSLLNQWLLIALPMNFISFNTNAPVVLSDIYSPFEISSVDGGTFYVDDVRIVDGNIGAPIFNVSANNISDGSTATNITWNPVVVSGIGPVTWTRANQYINLEIDPDSELTWGVQIYTNNTATNANPPFVSPSPPGQPGSNPAGLVGSPSVLPLPIAWSITAGTQTAVAAEPSAADPNNTHDPNSFLWFFMQDQATPTIPLESTKAFVPGQTFSIVKNNEGIQYAQSASGVFGASNPPNYIYLEANFGNSTAGTYQTNTLTVEFFTP